MTTRFWKSGPGYFPWPLFSARNCWLLYGLAACVLIRTRTRHCAQNSLSKNSRQEFETKIRGVETGTSARAPALSSTPQTGLPGDHSKREPPDPISNSEVKTLCADDSVGLPHVKVGHCQAIKFITPPWCGVFFRLAFVLAARQPRV